jgi:hypothetical protein
MTTFDRFEHACFHQGCREVALFGYGVDMRRGVAGVWSCATHRAELEQSRAQAQAPGDAPKQGSLI